MLGDAGVSADAMLVHQCHELALLPQGGIPRAQRRSLHRKLGLGSALRGVRTL